MSPVAPAVEAVELVYRYRDGTRALQGVTLSIHRGSRVALLGPNGAGKSTLLLHFNGIYRLQGGSLRVLGQDVIRAETAWLRSQVGLVFQDPDNQIFAPTVADDVAFGPLNLGLEREEVGRRVQASLRAVGLEDLAFKSPHHLSFGQKKRVAIAGVLAMEPEIIVLDEPMAFLDPQGQEEVLDILDRLHRRDKTVIMATHDVDLAAEWADTVIILQQGRVLAQGGTDFLTQSHLMQQAGLRLPRITQIFQRLPNGVPDGHLPRTVEDAVRFLRQNLSRPIS